MVATHKVWVLHIQTINADDLLFILPVLPENMDKWMKARPSLETLKSSTQVGLPTSIPMFTTWECTSQL